MIKLWHRVDCLALLGNSLVCPNQSCLVMCVVRMLWVSKCPFFVLLGCAFDLSCHTGGSLEQTTSCPILLFQKCLSCLVLRLKHALVVTPSPCRVHVSFFVIITAEEHFNRRSAFLVGQGWLRYPFYSIYTLFWLAQLQLFLSLFFSLTMCSHHC